MKRLAFVFLFVASLAASAVFLIAAASATPTATPTRPPPQAPTFTRTQPPNATPMLGPTSPIVFRGWVVSGPTKEEPLPSPCDWWWWVVQVEVDEVMKMEQQQAGCEGQWLYDYVPGEHIDVLYFADDAPQVAVDDYIEVSGEESMFSCACQECCCDACGFIFSPLAPVGGIAELPEVGEGGSSSGTYLALAGGLAAAIAALTAGAWYARRRWLG